MNLKRALIAMGYRELNSTMMAKPVGRSLFVVDVKRREWKRLFRGADDRTHTYERKTIEGTTYDECTTNIRNIETYSDNATGVDYDFAFTTHDDTDFKL